MINGAYDIGQRVEILIEEQYPGVYLWVEGLVVDRDLCLETLTVYVNAADIRDYRPAWRRRLFDVTEGIEIRPRSPE